MKKVFLAIIFVLLVIAIIVSGIYFIPKIGKNDLNDSSSQTKVSEKNEQKSPSALKDEEMQEDLKEALDNKNPSYCEGSYGHYSMSGDPSAWVDGCYKEYAKITFNVSVCELLHGSRGQCYYDLALLLKDVEICDKIPDASISRLARLECHAVLEKNYSYCYQMYEKPETVSRDSHCLVLVAFEKEDISGCDFADDLEYKQYCLAVMNGDFSYCDDVKSDYLDWCYYEYYLKTKDNSVCSRIEDNFRANLCE